MKYSYSYHDFLRHLRFDIFTTLEETVNEHKHIVDVGVVKLHCGCYRWDTHNILCMHELTEFTYDYVLIPLTCLNPHWTRLTFTSSILHFVLKFITLLKKKNYIYEITTFDNSLSLYARKMRNVHLCETQEMFNTKRMTHVQKDILTHCKPSTFKLVYGIYINKKQIRTNKTFRKSFLCGSKIVFFLWNIAI